MADREAEDPVVDDETAGDAGASRPDDSFRAAVEAKYDFANFRPADMARMSLDEWEAAFDPETWITGPELLDRIDAELHNRIADGQLFAVVERHSEGGEPRLLAYTDAEYVVVHPDGTVVGTDGIRQEIEPVVALCSMDSYDVPPASDDAGLPEPDSIVPGSGALGHRLLLVVAVVQLLAGFVLLLSPLLVNLGPGAGALAVVLGLGFIVVGVVIGLLVANARLSDRFRAADYRERLRDAGVGSDDRPGFLPTFDENGPAEGDEGGS